MVPSGEARLVCSGASWLRPVVNGGNVNGVGRLSQSDCLLVGCLLCRYRFGVRIKGATMAQRYGVDAFNRWSVLWLSAKCGMEREAGAYSCKAVIQPPRTD